MEQQVLGPNGYAGKKKLTSMAKERGPMAVAAFTEHEVVMAANIIDPNEITVSFEDIGGLEKIKDTLRHQVILPLERPELFRNSKLLTMPKGILLYGPPGTGKTMLAKAIARETRSVFINLQSSAILNKWFGETQKLVSALFTLAHKLRPAIIFIDELDAIFRTRGSAFEHEHTLQMKCEFMNNWDGLLTAEDSQIVVIGASNRPQDIDPAILRRLPVQLEVGLPDSKQRKQILELVLKSEKLSPNCHPMTLAEITQGYSGSDLKELCKVAAQVALRDYLRQEEEFRQKKTEQLPEMRPLCLEDFKAAMTKVKPNAHHEDVSLADFLPPMYRRPAQGEDE
jgi:SpoVK/Ycf46/Vps4 family AAA+-type ATPase